MRRLADLAFTAACAACALLACGVLALLVLAIGARGLPALDLEFLTQGMRGAGTEGGVLHHLLGTSILITTAAVVCTPLAVGTAVTHGFYLRTPAARGRLMLLLYAFNGVPSILLGLFGLIVFVVAFGWGKSWLAGGILLGLLMLPTVAVAMIERIEAIPRAQLTAAAGLGLRDSQVVRDVLLPQSAGGLVTGLLLGLARAAGETAPILFTATVFSGVAFPKGVTESPVLSLPYHVFVLAQDSLDPAAGRAVWGTATVLLLFVLALSALALPLRLRLREEARHG